MSQEHQSGQEHAEGKNHGNVLLSVDRWNEMDWDHNGFITFEEFVFSFYSWVDDAAE